MPLPWKTKNRGNLKLPALARAEMRLPGSKRSPMGVIELEAARIRVRGVVDGAALRVVLETLAPR